MSPHNLFLATILLLLVSCKEKSHTKTTIERRNEHKSVSIKSTQSADVHHDADTLFFRLDIITPKMTHAYLMDDKKRAFVILTKEIKSVDRFFSPNEIVNAIAYYEKNKKNNGTSSLEFLTTISIQKKEGNFQNICYLPNRIYLNDNKTFGINEIEMTLNDTIIKTQEAKDQKALQFVIKPDEQEERTYMLNFVFQTDAWNLISKERKSSSLSDKKTNAQYCVDSVNSGCIKKERGFEITLDFLLNMVNSKCY